MCVKCCWKIVTFNKGLYPATIFPDTQWPFKPDWGEGEWSLDFEPARPRCAPLLAWPLFIVSPGSVLYAKQAGLAAWTFANQFVCEGESTGVKDGLTGHTAPSLWHHHPWYCCQSCLPKGLLEGGRMPGWGLRVWEGWETRGVLTRAELGGGQSAWLGRWWGRAPFIPDILPGCGCQPYSFLSPPNLNVLRRGLLSPSDAERARVLRKS